ncbi:hypothetical protein JS562_15115 [Agrobacterium sp. S2]|nr:hypothetical protein [Agrobacterium sp. S2]
MSAVALETEQYGCSGSLERCRIDLTLAARITLLASFFFPQQWVSIWQPIFPTIEVA